MKPSPDPEQESRRLAEMERMKLKQNFAEKELERHQRLRQVNAEARASSKGRDEKRKEELWGKLIESSDKIIEGQMGYDNFVAVLCTMVIHYKKLQDALRATFSNYADDILNFAHSQLGDTPYDAKAVDQIKLEENVTFSNDDTFNLGRNLARGDGHPITDEQQALFNQAVKVWLGVNGYQPDPSKVGVFVHKETNAQLTKKQFDTLRDSETNGLAPFLTEYLAMQVRPAPSMGLSAR